MQTIIRAQNALRATYLGKTDDKGYTQHPQENLLPGVDLAKVDYELRRGDGDELKRKFCAIHSSAALAVNSFAPFKDRPEDIILAGHHGAKNIEFEKQLRIFRGGRAPNIDVWVDFGENVVAVESKLLEYLTPKSPKFSDAYERLAPPKSEPCWWEVYQLAKQGATQHLDRAQLIKHCFGLNQLQSKLPSIKLSLLYIFWEPLNWQSVDECKWHRDELYAFSEPLSTTQIPFKWMTYNELWDEWSPGPELREHSQNLKARYQVCI